MLWCLLSVLLALFCVFLTVLYWRCRYEKVPISVQEADDEFQEHETAPVSFNPTQDEIRDSQQYESAASSAISSESLQEEGDNFQEDSSCEDSSSVVEQYLTENRRYKAIQFLPKIGSRKNKSWCLVEPSNCPDSERQMVTVVKTDRSFSIALCNKMKAVSKLAGTLKHPYLQPIREIEYAEDINSFVTVHPFVARGSLKDIIYQTDPCTSWVQKQGRIKGSGLPQNKVALYGRQLLQVIHFLYEAGLFPLASLHSANVFLEDEDTCRLSGYENALLGYKVDVDREYMPHIDAIMFGRLLYEMSCGCLPQSLIPVEADLRAIVDRDLLEVLHLMFNMDAREGHFAALDHDEVVGLSFFQNVAHLVKQNPEQDCFTEVNELLKEVQTCESIVAEPDIFTEEAKQHFAQAVKKNGTIRVKVVTVLLVGAAGAGKTHFKHVLFGLDPPRVRNSTPVAENPLQAISVDFGTSEAVGVGGICLWHHVPRMEYDEVLAKEMLLQTSEITNECSDDAQSLSTESDTSDEEVSVSQQASAISHGAVDSISDTIACLDALCDLTPPTLNSNTQAATALASMGESQASMNPPTLNSNSGSSMIPLSLDISQAADSSVNVKPRSSGESLVASRESIADLELDHTLLELLKQPNNTKGIANTDWVHLIDTGGQPRCLQLIHAFIKHVSATALVTKLSERLDDFPTIETVVDGKRICQAYLSSLNNEQIIKYCLQMVKSQGTSKSVNTLLVGTHSDTENESEGIAEKDEKLRKDLQNDLIHYRAGNPDQLIFPLNCLNPEKKDLEVAQQFRQFVMKTAKHFTQDIPVLWYALNHLLHQYEVKYDTGVIEMDTCKKIAEYYLKMEPAAVANALAYLSSCNLILYFPKVLPNIVFCNMQVLLNILNQILTEVDSLHEGSSGPVSPEHIMEFRNKGILTHEVAAQFQCKNFGADDLLKLLKTFLIVAELDEQRYFMPVLLRDLPTEDLTEYRTQHPLVVYSPDGWLPCGAFTSIVAFLQGKTNFKYNSMKRQHRNCVNFDLPGGVPGCLTLIDSYQYFEVHVTSREFKTSSFHAICGVFDGLEEAISLFYEGLLYEPGFLCTECSCKHIAELSKFKNYWKCTVDGRVGDYLNEQQLLWFESIKGYKRSKHLSASRYNELASSTDPEITSKVFRTLRRDLANAIQLPHVFANELYSKGIITEGVKSKACDEYNGLDAARRNIAILDAIEAWLAQSSKNFQILLEAFAESDTAACYFAGRMKEALNNEMEKECLMPAVQCEECSLACNNQSQSLSAEDCSATTEVPLKGSLKESSLPTNKSNVEVAERFMFESEDTNQQMLTASKPSLGGRSISLKYEGAGPHAATYDRLYLPDLQDNMFPVRDKWYDIGLHIGLTCGDLDIIKAQYRDDFKDCLREMLKLRLSRAKPLNVAGIVLALQKTGAEDIAVQFKEKHCHSLIEVVPLTLPESQAQFYADVPVEIKTLKRAVKFAKRRCKILRSTFNDLVLEMKKRIKRKLTVSDFHKFLRGLSYSLKTEHRTYFKDTELSRHGTFDGLFNDLNLCWDFLNYNLLEYVFKTLGIDSLRTKMTEYCGDVSSFRKSTSLKIYQKVQKCKVSFEPQGFFHIITKHHARFIVNTTLEGVNNVRHKIAQELQLYDFALNIAEIGPVFITWLVPDSSLNDLMFALNTQLLDELHIENVTLRHSTKSISSLKEMEIANKQLLRASKRGDEKSVKEMLEKGTDVLARERNKYHRTPIMWSSYNQHLGTVGLLCSHRLCDLMIDLQDTNGWTGFLVACKRGNLDIVKLLQEHGANINHQTDEGWNGLMLVSSRKGCLSIVKHLLTSGADTELKDLIGWTPLMLATDCGHTEIVRELLIHGANPNAQNKCGMSALHIASNKGRNDIAQELCHMEGVDVNIQNEDELTPLMIAAQKGKNRIVKILLEEKADPNIQAMKASGGTALIMAVMKSNAEVVTTLLEFGADPKIKDTNRVTAVDIAAKTFFPKRIYRILLDATGLTEQEYKTQSKGRAGRVELSLRQLAHWYRLIEDRLLPEKAAKRIAQASSWTEETKEQ